MRSLLAVALLATAPGCKRDVGTYPTRVLISDGSGEQWFVGDLETGEVTDTYDLNTAHDADCGQGDSDLYCMLFQSRARVDHQGREEVVFSYNPVRNQSGADDLVFDTTIVAAGMNDHSRHWAVSALDFSVNYNGDQHCVWDPADPCSPHPDGDAINARTCRLYESHDVQVIEQDDEAITMWIADSRNARMVRVRATYNSECAVVEDVVNAKHVDWDIYITPNSFQYWKEDGVDNLLMSMKSSMQEADFTQEGGNARGKIVLMRNDGTGWDQAWEHPAESAVEESFVNAPHAVARTLAGGDEYVVFAHSLGLGSDFDDGAGGTVGVLRIDEGEPTYLFDGIIEGDTPWMYTRDITPLPDGLFLASDSGCTSGIDCEHPTGLYVVDLDLTNQGPGQGDGVFTPDSSRLDIRTVEVIAGPFFDDGASMIYSAENLGP